MVPVGHSFRKQDKSYCSLKSEVNALSDVQQKQDQALIFLIWAVAAIWIKLCFLLVNRGLQGPVSQLSDDSVIGLFECLSAMENLNNSQK